MLASNLPFLPVLRILETQRLSIRISTEEEYRNIFCSAGDDFIKEYFGINTDEELLVQKAKIAGGLTTYRTSLMFFHLIDKGLNKVIGSFAYHNWYPVHRRSEIGYAISDESYKNKGYMREAMPAMITYGFEGMHLNRIEAFIHPENTPSRKLAEGAGLRKEALLQEHYMDKSVVGDSLVYSLLQKDYAGLSS